MGNLNSANLSKITQLQPGVALRVAVAMLVGDHLGVTWTITSGFRTYAQQEALYRAWLEGRNPYPANRPGTSKHEKGEAVDITPAGDPLIVETMRLLGLKWKGTRDPVHFEI